MKKLLVITISSIALAACQSTSGPVFQPIPATPDSQNNNRMLIAEALKKYNWFGEYVISSPKELIVESAKIGKPLGFIPVSTASSNSEYCVDIVVQDPERMSFASRTAKTLRVYVSQETNNTSNKRVVFSWSPRQPACYLHSTGEDFKEIIGARLMRSH
jgi:hypothetical protein